VPHVDELREILDNNGARMSAVVYRQLRQYRDRLRDFQEKAVLESPLGYIQQRRQVYEYMRERLSGIARQQMGTRRERYVEFAAKLDAMSPLKVLGRGYSVVKSGDGRVLNRAKDVEIGETINVALSEGALTCKVEGRE